MVKLLIGLKGLGKTKTLIESANSAIDKEAGHIICIEKGTKLTFDLNHSIRLIDISSYNVSSFNQMLAFIGGILASDYDVTAIFIDSILKICGEDFAEFEKFLNEISKINDKTFFITASVDEKTVPASIKNFVE
jgi:hypothetical protein